MRTVTITFKSNGQTIKKVAVINDNLSELSCCKKNMADSIEEYEEDGYWSLIFMVDEKIVYEVEFAIKNHCRTLTPVKAITWENDIIDDVQKIDSLTIK